MSLYYSPDERIPCSFLRIGLVVCCVCAAWVCESHRARTHNSLSAAPNIISARKGRRVHDTSACCRWHTHWFPLHLLVCVVFIGICGISFTHSAHCRTEPHKLWTKNARQSICLRVELVKCGVRAHRAVWVCVCGDWCDGGQRISPNSF